jgi:hypothetical protein
VCSGETIAFMTEAARGELTDRLHLVAVELVLADRLRVEEAVVLAEDLLAAGYTGSATVEVACLERRTTRRDAEQPIREMLAEHGIRPRHPTNAAEEYELLLTAFGYWDLPLQLFEGPFYARIPAWEDQGALDRTLVVLLDRRDAETTQDARLPIEDEMRAAVRAHIRVG